MKTFRFYYWTEINDESVDREMDIVACSKEEALIEFKAYTVFKVIDKIEELNK